MHVPEYEAREAAIYCHYNWTEFGQLDTDEQAACIAQYRIHTAIEVWTAETYRPRGRRGR